MTIKNKTILITGIGQFLGLRTAEKMIAQGLKVRGLHDNKKQAEKAKNIGAEVIIGDINDTVIAKKACQGVDVVIHTHELAKEGGEIKEFRQVNVNGTINIAKAAKKEK
ncbi:oxidoreductase [Richelia intracellularis]|nr:oxidoreductase [Richelia intracellularis]